MTLFTRSQQGLPRRRMALFCLFLGGVLITPASARHRAHVRRSISVSVGTTASPLKWRWCSLVLRSILSSLTCFADMGRTANSGSSNWWLTDLAEDWRTMRVHRQTGHARPRWPGHQRSELVKFMKIISDGMDEKKYPIDVRDEFLAVWRSFHDGVVQK